jgi:hypothetical protein
MQLAYWRQHELPNVCPKDYWQLGDAERRTPRRMRRRPRVIRAFWEQAQLLSNDSILSRANELNRPGEDSSSVEPMALFYYQPVACSTVVLGHDLPRGRFGTWFTNGGLLT